VVLKKALESLKRTVEEKRLALPRPSLFFSMAAVPDRARPYLERMRLDAPKNLKEHLLQRVMVYALASVNAI
jgi:hypothetical protein